jgi:hypothetical protein
MILRHSLLLHQYTFSICKDTAFIWFGKIYFLPTTHRIAKCETIAAICETAVWGKVCIFASWKQVAKMFVNCWNGE